MSARAVIDSLEFARSGTELHGEVAVAELARLADNLYDRGGSLRYLLRGQTDERQRLRLRLEVAGTIHLMCQRCLGRLPYQVALESRLLLLDEMAGGAEAEIEDLDAVAANPETDVWSLVEDEVLLALPMAPRHDDGDCQAALADEKDAAASPFAVLAGLKNKQVN